MIDLRFLPTRAEFERARSTARAYVVVDGTGLRWVPRPVLNPPRPRRPCPFVFDGVDFTALETRVLAQLRAEWKAWADPEEPPTVRRWSSEAVAERVIADAVGRSP